MERIQVRYPDNPLEVEVDRAAIVVRVNTVPNPASGTFDGDASDIPADDEDHRPLTGDDVQAQLDRADSLFRFLNPGGPIYTLQWDYDLEVTYYPGDAVNAYNEDTSTWYLVLCQDVPAAPADGVVGEDVFDSDFWTPVCQDLGSAPVALRAHANNPHPDPVTSPGLAAPLGTMLQLQDGSFTTAALWFHNGPGNTEWVDLLAGGGGGEGTVQSVNDIEPDEDGNIELTATDIGATDIGAVQIYVGGAIDDLNLGSASQADTGAFDPAGAAAAAQAAAIAASQPVDSDLTAIAALTTTSYGRAFLALADAAAGRTALGLGTAATQASGAFDASGSAAAAQAASQPLDSDLTAIAALATTSIGRSLLAAADAAAIRAIAGAETSGAAAAAQAVSQPLDSDLTAIAALTTTSTGRSLLAAADAAAIRSIAGAETAGAAAAAQAASQPLDSDLTAIAALTTTTFGRAVLALADAAALRTAGGLVIGTDVEAHDADLTTIAGLSPSNDDFLQRKAGAWANRTVAQVKTDLGISATAKMTPFTLLPFGSSMPATLGATLDIRPGGSSPVEGFPVLDFDGAAIEYADWIVSLPPTYAGGGLTVDVQWMATSGTSNAVVFGAAFRRLQIGTEDLDTSQTYDYNDAAAVNAPGTNGALATSTVTFTNGSDMDSVAAGEPFVLRVRRNATDTGDTMSGSDAELLVVTVRET